LGGNFIDTADSYGPNVSEELIAEALVGCGGEAEAVEEVFTVNGAV
jgi:aryl-alcohol dehydrogenase-like predicted oxidoreductase